jgi:DNA-binding transcriptional MerR regulator
VNSWHRWIKIPYLSQNAARLQYHARFAYHDEVEDFPMPEHPDRKYSIGEVSALTDVPVYLLRQWEKRVAALKPKRWHNGRRYYSARDVEIVKRIKYLTRHEGMTLRGAALQISAEIHGEGKPKTTTELKKLVSELERRVRNLLDELGTPLEFPKRS